jgi:hypothetical protein
MTMVTNSTQIDTYYTARRDSEGNIRLNNGKGALVANSDHTIADVQGWLDRATEDKWKAQYRAALKLMLDEAFTALAA